MCLPLYKRPRPEDFGKYLVIDTETRTFEMDGDDYQASIRAYTKNPTGRGRYGVRVGHPSVEMFRGGVPAVLSVAERVE